MSDDKKEEALKKVEAEEVLETTAKVAERPKIKPKTSDLLVELMVSPMTCLCTCWHRTLVPRAALCNRCGRRICGDCLISKTIILPSNKETEVAYCNQCNETPCPHEAAKALTTAGTKS